MYEYLIIGSRFLNLDELRSIANQFHDERPLPEEDMPERAPAIVGVALCLRYQEVRANIGLWLHVSSHPEIQAHLIS